jgi:hypothetical protein
LYDAAAPCRCAEPRSEPTAPPVVAPVPALAAAPLGPPAGFRLAAPSEDLAGSAPGPCRPGGALPLAGGGLGPRYGDRSQPCRRLLARCAVTAVRPHLRPRGGGGGLAPRRGLARPCWPLGSPPACGALIWLPFSGSTVMGLPADRPVGRKPTVAGCNGPV